MAATALASSPTIPRLQMEPTGAARTLLDGGWWPRSTDPVTELPGLVLAIDRLHGKVIRLALSTLGWDSHPRGIRVGQRVVRLGYFASQHVSLLTALCDNGGRVDLLIVAPDTPSDLAEKAMMLAATAGNVVHAPDLLAVAGAAE